MNPASEEPTTPQVAMAAPNLDPTTFVPQDSSPEADFVALQAIGALEAEEDTSPFVEPVQGTVQQGALQQDPSQPQAPVTDMTPPATTEEPTVSPENILPTSAAELTQVNSNPFPKQKSSKKLVLVLITAIVFIGGATAGYFVWQSMQTGTPVEASQTASGNQPGGAAEASAPNADATLNEN